MKSKKLTRIIFYMIIGIVLLLPTRSKAVLQSNGGTPAEYNVNDWIKTIRQMQQTGGALGLTDTINGTNLTSGNKNLDIHMEKNTEYGAMLILSASSYGNPNKIADGGTTTGNKTGIVMKINHEWVAGGTKDIEAVTMKNASGRYKNIYTNDVSSAKAGDAIATIGSWHGAKDNTWIGGPYPNRGAIVRARTNKGSIFSYSGFNWPGVDTDADHNNKRHSRAAIVCGSGV